MQMNHGSIPTFEVNRFGQRSLESQATAALPRRAASDILSPVPLEHPSTFQYMSKQELIHAIPAH